MALDQVRAQHLKGFAIPNLGQILPHQIAKHRLTPQISAASNDVTARRHEQRCPRTPKVPRNSRAAAAASSKASPFAMIVAEVTRPASIISMIASLLTTRIGSSFYSPACYTDRPNIISRRHEFPSHSDAGAAFRTDQPQSQTGEGLRGSNRLRNRIPLRRLRPAFEPQTYLRFMIFRTAVLGDSKRSILFRALASLQVTDLM
jgi:hypothetical protein